MTVEMFTVLQLFRATSIRLASLRSYGSYARQRLKINAINSREMCQRLDVFLPLVSKLHGHDARPKPFTVLQQLSRGATSMQPLRRSCRRYKRRRLKINAIKLRARVILAGIFIKAHSVPKTRLPSFRSQLYLIKSDLHAFRRSAVNPRSCVRYEKLAA